MAKVEIRPLSAGDVSAYRRVRLEALSREPQAFSSSVEEEALFDEAFFATRAVPEAPGVTFGAFLDGDLVGIAGYVPERRVKTRHKATLVGLYVLPAARGLKIGQALAARVIEHARKRRVMLHLSVLEGNLAARRIYRGLGFVSYGIDPCAVAVDGRFLDDELMVLDLR